MINDELREFGTRLRGQVPDDVVALYEGDLAAGEPHLALEDLFDRLDLDGVTISASLAAEIWRFAQRLAITRFDADDLARITRSPA